jgi:hypothetical protein
MVCIAAVHIAKYKKIGIDREQKPLSKNILLLNN